MPLKLLIAALSMLVIASSPTLAATCHDIAVTARGEPSRFMWLAKTKARSNWRRQVRLTDGLGPDYAVWPNAAETTERCVSGPEGTLCIFTGTPCKP